MTTAPYMSRIIWRNPGCQGCRIKVCDAAAWKCPRDIIITVEECQKRKAWDPSVEIGTTESNEYGSTSAGYYDRYLSAQPGGPEMRHIGNWNQNWMMNVPGSESAAGRITMPRSASLSPKRILSSDNTRSLLENATRSFGASDRSLSGRISFSFENACASWVRFWFWMHTLEGGCLNFRKLLESAPGNSRSSPRKHGKTDADNRGGSISLRVLLENVRRSGGLMEEKQRRVVVDTMSGEYHRRRRMQKVAAA